MEWLRRALISMAWVVGLSMTVSTLAIPHADASSQVELRAEVAVPASSPTGGQTAATIREPKNALSNTSDDERGSPPVFAFVCALIGFAVIVYLVMRRMRSTDEQ